LESKVGNAKKDHKLSKFASKAGRKKGRLKRNDAESASKDAYSTKLHKAGKTVARLRSAPISPLSPQVIQKSSKVAEKMNRELLARSLTDLKFLLV
jgi:hypothetical protein